MCAGLVACTLVLKQPVYRSEAVRNPPAAGVRSRGTQHPALCSLSLCVAPASAGGISEHHVFCNVVLQLNQGWDGHHPMCSSTSARLAAVREQPGPEAA